MVQQLRACTAPAGVEFSFQHQSGYNISVPRDPTPSSSLPDTDTTRHTSPDRHTDIYTIFKKLIFKDKETNPLTGYGGSYLHTKHLGVQSRTTGNLRNALGTQ